MVFDGTSKCPCVTLKTSYLTQTTDTQAKQKTGEYRDKS